MGIKAMYTDMRSKIIRELTKARDSVAIMELLHDRNEYRTFSKGWRAVNLDEFASKFGIVDDIFNVSHNKRKITFTKDGKSFSIIAAVGGKYFRIKENGTGKKNGGKGGRYVDLDLKDPSIPGNFQGAERRAENLRLTHFRMTFKKGTV